MTLLTSTTPDRGVAHGASRGTKNRSVPFGSPAILAPIGSLRPEALRQRLSTLLPLSLEATRSELDTRSIYNCNIFRPNLQVYVEKPFCEKVATSYFGNRGNASCEVEEVEKGTPTRSGSHRHQITREEILGGPATRHILRAEKLQTMARGSRCRQIACCSHRLCQIDLCCRVVSDDVGSCSYSLRWSTTSYRGDHIPNGKCTTALVTGIDVSRAGNRASPVYVASNGPRGWQAGPGQDRGSAERAGGCPLEGTR